MLSNSNENGLDLIMRKMERENKMNKEMSKSNSSKEGLVGSVLSQSNNQSIFRKNKLNFLSEEYNLYIQKYHGFYSLLCQRSFCQLTQSFDDQFSLEDLLRKKGISQKIDEEANLNTLMTTDNLLVIDIENVLVMKVVMNEDN